MNQFLPRIEPVASVVSVKERSPGAVRAVSGAGAAQTKTEAGAQFDPHAAERTAASANYARIQASIASVLAEIQPSRTQAKDAVDSANDAITALMTRSVIMLPMPPTDPEIVAFVAQVAQSVAQQAAQARAAQANATPILVEAAAN